MAYQTLIRRAAQADLLRRACALRVLVRAAVADASPWSARIVSLRPDGLTLAAEPAGAVAQAASMEVRFALEDGAYRLSARVRHAAPSAVCEARGTIELCWPLRIERELRRVAVRIGAAELPTIVVRMSEIKDPQRRFLACLCDVSRGGLGVIAPSHQVETLRAGAMYCAMFELPDEPGPFEFPLRLVHGRPVEGALKHRLGWAFLAGDGPGVIDRQIERVVAFVGGRPAHGAGARRAPHKGGERA
jgi:hypothetical protein